jgi:hypothetical protein
MITTAVQQYAKAIGEEIGNSDDITQADLLNGFFEMFDHSIPDRTINETQIAGVTRRLSPRSKKVLIRFAEFCKEWE